MQEKNVIVKHPIGLRARHAAIFSTKAQEFTSTVNIRANGRLLNGKSLLGVLSANIDGGTTITIHIDGPDEEEAMKVLTELVESDFSNY